MPSHNFALAETAATRKYEAELQQICYHFFVVGFHHGLALASVTWVENYKSSDQLRFFSELLFFWDVHKELKI